MKLFLTACAALALFAALAIAAGIDGKWVAEAQDGARRTVLHHHANVRSEVGRG